MDELYGYKADIDEFLVRNAAPQYRKGLLRLINDIAKRGNVSAGVAMAYFDGVLDQCSECKRFFPATDEYFAPGRWKHVCLECNEAQAKTMSRNERVKAYRHKFSRKQKRFALEYFNNCCAVCGHQLLDLFGDTKLHFDHWIPLSDPATPGTVVTNMIPLCGGKGGCNNSKHARDPREWLTARYGKRRAQAIIDRIEAYFAIVGQSD